jgi:hypothetical protein
MRTARVGIFLLAVGFGVPASARCLAIDGDTLVCDRQKIRLTNVYAAELNQTGGAAAKRRLQAAVQAGAVTLRPHGQDRYGRLLAEVYVNGRRIEQADIGPRAGAGSALSADRHVATGKARRASAARPAPAR